MVQKTADMISAVFFIVFFNLSTEGVFRYFTSCSILKLLIIWIHDHMFNPSYNSSFSPYGSPIQWNDTRAVDMA